MNRCINTIFIILFVSTVAYSQQFFDHEPELPPLPTSAINNPFTGIFHLLIETSLYGEQDPDSVSIEVSLSPFGAINYLEPHPETENTFIFRDKFGFYSYDDSYFYMSLKLSENTFQLLKFDYQIKKHQSIYTLTLSGGAGYTRWTFTHFSEVDPSITIEIPSNILNESSS